MNEVIFHLNLLKTREAKFGRKIQVFRRELNAERTVTVLVPKNSKIYRHFVASEPGAVKKALRKAVEHFGLVPRVIIPKSEQITCGPFEKKSGGRLVKLRRKLKKNKKVEKVSDINHELMTVLYKKDYTCHVKMTKENGYVCTVLLRNGKMTRSVAISPKKRGKVLTRMSRREAMDRAACKAFMRLKVMDDITSVDLETAFHILKMRNTIKKLENTFRTKNQ